MLFCFLNRKRMVDYFEGSLSPDAAQAVRRHLEVCVRCREVFSGSEAVVRLAASKRPVEPDAAFWDDFDATLERKLDAAAAKREAARARRLLFHVHLRPALAMLSLAVVVVAVGVRLGPLGRSFRSGEEIADLVNEAVLLDELAPNGDNGDIGADDIMEEALTLSDSDARGE